MEDGVRVRRAEHGDAEFIVALLADHDVEPFLAGAAARTPDEVLSEVERSIAEPEEFGRFVIEVREGDRWQRAGLMGFQLRNRRNRIASTSAVAGWPTRRRAFCNAI
jgi:hypothetical protein